MALKLKNSKRGDSYYDETGQVTTDPNKIKNIQRVIKTTGGTGTKYSVNNKKLTTDEYKTATSKKTTKDASPQALEAKGVVTGETAAAEKEAQDVKTLEAAGAFEDRPIEETDLTSGETVLDRLTGEESRDTFKTEKQLEKEAQIQTERELKMQQLVADNASAYKISSNKAYYDAKEFMNNLIPAAKSSGFAALEVGATIPFVGDVVTAFIEDPQENIGNIQASIVTYKGLADDIGSEMTAGRLSTQEGLRQLNVIDQQIEDAIAEIKKQSARSVVLKTSSELVDVQADLLETQQAIFDNKQVAAGEILQEQDPKVLNANIERLKEKYEITN